MEMEIIFEPEDEKKNERELLDWININCLNCGCLNQVHVKKVHELLDVLRAGELYVLYKKRWKNPTIQDYEMSDIAQDGMAFLRLRRQYHENRKNKQNNLPRI